MSSADASSEHVLSKMRDTVDVWVSLSEVEFSLRGNRIPWMKKSHLDYQMARVLSRPRVAIGSIVECTDYSMDWIEKVVGHAGRKSCLQDGIVPDPWLARVIESPVSRLVMRSLMKIEREPG